KISGQRVYISDPASGLMHYSHEDFRDAWEMKDDIGGLLVLEATPEFYAQEDIETSASFGHFMRYLKPYHKYLAQVLTGMMGGILIGVLTPFISQSIVDFGIGAGNMRFINA